MNCPACKHAFEYVTDRLFGRTLQVCRCGSKPMAVSPLRLAPHVVKEKRMKPQKEHFVCEYCSDDARRAEGSTRTYCSKSMCTSMGKRAAGRKGGQAKFANLAGPQPCKP